MKKIGFAITSMLLLASAIGAFALGSSGGESIKEISFTLDIDKDKLVIERSWNGEISVAIENLSTFIINPGKPRLPKVVKVIELPFGAKVISVDLKTNYSPLDGSFETLPSDLYPSNNYYYRVSVGLNRYFDRVTFVSVHWYPVKYSEKRDKLYVATHAEVTIKYNLSKKPPFPEKPLWDMVIIAPKKFEDALQRLVDHKNEMGIKTFIKPVEEIYDEYPYARDRPEQIKMFIKDAIEKYGIKYVLLVGGLKSMIYAKPRDDANQGSRDWYVPVRYNNLYDKPKFPLTSSEIYDPGCLTDLYYADIYKEGGVFDDWDPNNDGIISAWGKPGVENDTSIDLCPDVLLGRLPCRNLEEVKTVVNKIINYERNAYGKDWFKRIIVVSGDGFLDQQDLNITFDTNGLPNGEYTLYAQSFNADGIPGPKDTIHFTIDRTRETRLTFKHKDNENPAIRNESGGYKYPAPPIAEIVTISPGDNLGYNDYTYSPSEREAYCNNIFHWADISYKDGVLTIRGKSYDPRPYGCITSIHVWIKDSNGRTVFSAWRNNTEMYFEGEWTTGERKLLYRGGALYYMPSDFEREILWTSNGKLRGIEDVVRALNKGAGFVFMSGHGSPNVWADHFPGIPGNRINGEVVGLNVVNFKKPYFPVDSLKNGEKLPVIVIGGCHTSMFNVSLVLTLYDMLPFIFKWLPKVYMWTFGIPVPECLNWRLVRNPHGGGIAAIGNTGLGYGMPGRNANVGGGDSWITIEFFRQYGEEGLHILGQAYQQAIVSYINTFNMEDFEAGHIKTVQEWTLLGDPSLMIGGYP